MLDVVEEGVVVDEEDVVTMLDVIVELALLEVDVEALVEEGHVDEELVLALALHVDDEHGEKEVVGEVLASAVVGRTG